MRILETNTLTHLFRSHPRVVQRDHFLAYSLNRRCLSPD